MPHAIKIENETGTHYWPKNYGFGVHAFTQDISQAEQFETEAKANARIVSYRYPSLRAFWNSEREYATRHENKTRHWRFDVVTV